MGGEPWPEWGSGGDTLIPVLPYLLCYSSIIYHLHLEACDESYKRKESVRRNLGYGDREKEKENESLAQLSSRDATKGPLRLLEIQL